ncbi:Remorin family protein [Melia azedarach]|uniref:Remorin family protein n=1 Tax=Melia azedarach TaxID=155640 RepID=A0ACC1XNX2_MELAZ|nr:Remorin family protein [Melia azedarach]
MENLNNQKRVRFSEEESNNRKERNLSSQIESFTGFLGDKLQNWFQKFPVLEMGEDYYDPRKSEFAAAVAAAAFSIYSVEEAEARYRRKMREELERTQVKSVKDQDSITRRFSGRDLKIGGESISSRNSGEVDRRVSRSSSVRSMNSVATDRRQKGILPSKSKREETKADAWEREQIEKLNKRYEKTKSAVVAWENEKKSQARLKMEKKKAELEQRRKINEQHYQNKIARIERIAGGARAQAEEDRRNKEIEIKQRARKVDVHMKYCICC